jgi:hypothetical protein
MTTLIEAAKLALKALERYAPQHGNPDDMIDAITALRTAIETYEKQEPVAWAVFEGGNAHDLYLPQEYDEALKMAGYKGDHAEVKPLYTTPPAAERNKVAQWMIAKGYATGHGDTTEDLLEELDWQITESWSKVIMASVESVREANALLCEQLGAEGYGSLAIAAAIRLKGKE